MPVSNAAAKNQRDPVVDVRMSSKPVIVGPSCPFVDPYTRILDRNSKIVNSMFETQPEVVKQFIHTMRLRFNITAPIEHYVYAREPSPDRVDEYNVPECYLIGEIIGEGNCFFRSLSRCIFGTQDAHATRDVECYIIASLLNYTIKVKQCVYVSTPEMITKFRQLNANPAVGSIDSPADLDIFIVHTGDKRPNTTSYDGQICNHYECLIKK